MNTEFLIGLVAFFAALVLNRFLMDTALRKLTAEEKVRLVDLVAARNNSLRSAIVFSVMIFFMICLYYLEAYRNLLIFSFFGLFILYLAVMTLLGSRKLITAEMPAGYMRLFYFGSLFLFLGFAVLFSIVGRIVLTQ